MAPARCDSARRGARQGGIIHRVPHLNDEGICIRHWDFSETSQTVSLFCRGHGILRGLGKGSKRSGGRFSGGIDLLTRGEIVAIVKPGRELATLTDWSLLHTWRSLRTDLAANKVAYYMADLSQRLIAPSDPHPAVYDVIVRCLDAIESGQPALSSAWLFQWVLLDDIGYRPRLDLDADGPSTVHFSAAEGGISNTASPGSWKVRRTTVELLARTAEVIESGDTASFFAHLHSAHPEVVDRANRLLAAYLQHLVGVPLETMRALFPDR